MATQKLISSVEARREIARLFARAKEEGSSDGYAGKRKSARVVDPLFLDITTDPDDESIGWGVTMHDISPGGVSFWSRTQLPVDNTIYLRERTEYNARPWLVAHIRHRTIALQGYLIGAEFDVASADETASWQRAGSGLNIESGSMPVTVAGLVNRRGC